MDLRPISTHLFTILTNGIEVGHLVRAENVVSILRDLRLQRGHDRELLAGENRREQRQILGRCLGIAGNVTRPNHRLLAEVFDMRALRQKLRHVADMMSGLLGEHGRRTRQHRRAHEYRHIRECLDELLHQRQILRAVIFRRHMDLQERNVDLRQIVVEPLRRIRHQHLDPRQVVCLQPGLQRPADKPAANDSDFDFTIHK